MRIDKNRATMLGMFGAFILSITLALLPYSILGSLLMPNIENTDIALLSLLAIFIVIGMTCLVAGTFANKSFAKLLGYLSMSFQYGVFIILFFLTAVSLAIAIIYLEFAAFTVSIIGGLATAALGFSINYLWKNYDKDQPLSKSKAIALSCISIICCILISLIVWVEGVRNETMYYLSMVFAASTIPYIFLSLGLMASIPSPSKSAELHYLSETKLGQACTSDQELDSISESGLTMYCRYCGKMVPVDSVYCAYCGRRLR